MLKTLLIQKPEYLWDALVSALSVSKRQAKFLLDQKRVSVNGQRVWMTKHKLKRGDKVEVYLEKKTTENSKLHVIYEDKYLFILNKPPGIATTGARSFSEVVKATYPDARPIHRLDKDTTGCLLFARDSATEQLLIALFKKRDIKKHYAALVCGRRPRKHYTIRETLDEQSAETRLNCEKTVKGISLVRLEILTGRTHQIRKHLESIGCAVLGDARYGKIHQPEDLSPAPPRCLLHAELLAFTHPVNGKTIHVRAPFPPDFKRSMKVYGFSRR